MSDRGRSYRSAGQGGSRSGVIFKSLLGMRRSGIDHLYEQSAVSRRQSVLG
ncbi:MAG: hypothetical protein AB7G88_01050 [Thermomicrobiales bacterium]